MAASVPAWPGSIPTPYFLIQAALPSLRESALKSEVNISSSSGILRLSGQPVFGMTKNALDYLPGRGGRARARPGDSAFLRPGAAQGAR